MHERYARLKQQYEQLSEEKKERWGKMPLEEDFTCHECLDKDVCQYSFDLYNTNGDCLAFK